MKTFSLKSFLQLLFCLSVFHGSIFDTAVTQKMNFKPVTDVNGSVYCATSRPTAVVAVSDIAAIPDGVPEPVRCAYGCTGFVNCTSFNYRTTGSMSPVGVGVCELFNYIPRNCSAQQIVSNCFHYQVSFLFSNEYKSVRLMEKLWTRFDLSAENTILDDS
jgi:hypothetical protein